MESAQRISFETQRDNIPWCSSRRGFGVSRKSLSNENFCHKGGISKPIMDLLS